MEYNIGQAVTIFIEGITDPDGVVQDPATLQLTVVKPDGTPTVYAIGDLVHVGLGSYKLLVTPAAGESGEWQWEFVTTDPDTSDSGSFTVRRSIVAGGTQPLIGGTCSPWAEPGDVHSGPASTYDFDIGLLEDGLQFASDVLYDLTRRQWPGECQETVRPCGYATGRMVPQQDPVSGYMARGWCGCNRSRDCGCARLSEYRLPGYPVTSILGVKIDGTTVDRARYRLDDNRWLVYLPADGEARRGWPCCQRLDLADTEADTWSVTYTYGLGPPVGGRISAARLGAELAVLWSGNTAACALSPNVTSVSRQGVSKAMRAMVDAIKEGGTGLPDVDMWVGAVLAGISRKAASVHRPGKPNAARRSR